MPIFGVCLLVGIAFACPRNGSPPSQPSEIERVSAGCNALAMIWADPGFGSGPTTKLQTIESINNHSFLLWIWPVDTAGRPRKVRLCSRCPKPSLLEVQSSDGTSLSKRDLGNFESSVSEARLATVLLAPLNSYLSSFGAAPAKSLEQILSFQSLCENEDALSYLRTNYGPIRFYASSAGNRFDVEFTFAGTKHRYYTERRDPDVFKGRPGSTSVSAPFEQPAANSGFRFLGELKPSAGCSVQPDLDKQ